MTAQDLAVMAGDTAPLECQGNTAASQSLLVTLFLTATTLTMEHCLSHLPRTALCSAGVQPQQQVLRQPAQDAQSSTSYAGCSQQPTVASAQRSWCSTRQGCQQLHACSPCPWRSPAAVWLLATTNIAEAVSQGTCMHCQSVWALCRAARWRTPFAKGPQCPVRHMANGTPLKKAHHKEVDLCNALQPKAKKT
jgi:hypothetical protein